MKIKTLQDNVSFYGEKKGAVSEVSEVIAKHYIDLGVAEEVKPKPAPKKATPKVQKDGDK